MILGLEFVGVVRVGRDGTIGSQHSILPRVLPLFNSIPSYKTISQNAMLSLDCHNQITSQGENQNADLQSSLCIKLDFEEERTAEIK